MEINYTDDNIENVRNDIKKEYPQSLILFLNENPLADEVFYLKRELKSDKIVLKSLKKDTAFFNLSAVNNETPRFRNYFFRITERNKFCKLRLKELQQPEPEPLDLSDSNTAYKIAYLYESGIIDFLHKKDDKPHTVNSIASLLSAITGIKAKTIQSAINPFINTHSTSKGKPAQSTLTKAKSKLIDLGF